MRAPKKKDLIRHNKLVQILKQTANKGIRYKSGLDWNNLVAVGVSDAGHGGTDVVVEYDEEEVREPFRSQGGKLVFLADPSILTNKEAMMHLISFSSAALKRVLRATIQAEVYQLQLTVEGMGMVRAAYIDARGLLDHKDWEMSAASQCQAIWFTDCKKAVMHP